MTVRVSAGLYLDMLLNRERDVEMSERGERLPKTRYDTHS